MTENEKLRALLAQARPILWLHRPSGDADCDCRECRAIVAVVARIDAALAEPGAGAGCFGCAAANMEGSRLIEQRDEARAEVEKLREAVNAWAKTAEWNYKRGAEAMREVAAVRVDGEGINVGPHFASIVRDLPIPEDKP